MDTPDHYPDARAALSAIKQGAHAHSEQTGIHVAQAVALAYMDRFLSRIFGSSGAESWMLKGGTSMLARISNARSTRDLDLTHCAADLRVALQELKDLAGRDLGDHFQFVFHNAEAIRQVQGPYRPYGLRVGFETYAGTKSLGKVSVDLTTCAAPAGDVTVCRPVALPPLPRLVTAPYRLFPVEDQIADKYCAIVEVHGGAPSSRIKDLVDLVLLATNVPASGHALELALAQETHARQLQLLPFAIPSSWTPEPFRQLAAKTELPEVFRSLPGAVRLVSQMLDPAIRGEVNGLVWEPGPCKWARQGT